MTARVTTITGLANRRSRSSVDSAGTDALLQQGLQNIYDVGLTVCVVAVPLTMAGIREYGVALFLLCSFVMGIVWAARQLLTPSSASPMAAAAMIACLAIGLVWLQIQPLSEQLLADLSPFNAKFLMLWGGTQGEVLDSGGWNQISMTPEATRSGLVLLIAYVTFFLTLTQRLRTQEDVDRLIKLIGISVSVMAFIGMAQVLVGDDKYLWIIEDPARTASWPAKGTFTNQNHFAHFLALGIGPLVWWWQSLESPNQSSGQRQSSYSKGSRRSTTKRQQRSNRNRTLPAGGFGLRLIVGVCIGVVALGAVCSTSRGGIASFIIASVVALAVLGKSLKSVVRLIVPLGIFLIASLLAFGTDELMSRWDQITMSRSIDDLSHGRWALWTALSQAIPEFWPAGSGVGSHADVYPIWLSEQFTVRFTHAESGYLQILLETGLPGFVLLFSGIGLCGWWCLQGWSYGDQQQRRRVIALAAGLLVSVLHSVVDFVWYIPGCVILTLVIVACTCRSSQLTLPPTTSSPRRSTRFATLFAGILLLSVLPVGQLFADTVQRDLGSLPYWQSFHNDKRTIAKSASDDKEKLLGEKLDSLINDLEQCIERDPFHHAAYAALAPLYLLRFEQRSKASDNQMTIQDIRDTVREAGFENSQELHKWLTRALGENVRDLHRAVHTARRALRERPLRGDAYLVLSETAFLTELSQSEQEAVIAQAVLLRPHRPNVLFAAGLLAENSGDVEAAWQLWRRAAALDSVVAQQLVTRFVDRIPTDEFLERLEPARDIYWTLYITYGRAKRPADQKTVAVYFAERHREALAGEEIGTTSEWSKYARMLITANYNLDALECFRHAVRLRPEDSSSRQLLAETLIDEGMLEEAHRELNWLHLRMPDNRRIVDLLNEVKAGLANTD